MSMRDRNRAVIGSSPSDCRSRRIADLQCAAYEAVAEQGAAGAARGSDRPPPALQEFEKGIGNTVSAGRSIAFRAGIAIAAHSDRCRIEIGVRWHGHARQQRSDRAVIAHLRDWKSATDWIETRRSSERSNFDRSSVSSGARSVGARVAMISIRRHRRCTAHRPEVRCKCLDDRGDDGGVGFVDLHPLCEIPIGVSTAQCAVELIGEQRGDAAYPGLRFGDIRSYGCGAARKVLASSIMM